ncbi:Copy number protein [Clostridium perfringens]|nr:copy number protein [Clostridium perfringens NCTC 8239]
MINDKELKDLIFSILIILFVVLSLNIIVFFSYNKIAEIDHSIFIIILLLNLIFILISLIYLIFSKKLIAIPNLLNLFLGILFSLSSLQNLIISLNIFYQKLNTFEFILTFIIFFIIYILFLSFFLIAIKNKLKNKYRNSKQINKSIFILAALIGLIFSKINFHISQCYILSLLIYVLSCIFTFGFYHVYIFINSKKIIK